MRMPIGGAGGLAFEHAGKNLDFVAFAALAHELRSAGAAAIHIGLQICLVELKARWTAVDDAAERRTVALAKGGHGEQSA